MIVHTKTPSESFAYDFDFAGEFAPGDPVASSVVTASPADGVITLGAKVHDALVVQQTLSAGTDGADYTITCVATSAGGTIAELSLLLRVRAMLPRTVDTTRTRDQTIADALRKLRILGVGGTPTAAQLAEGASAFDLIIREESAKAHSLKPTWGLAHATIALTDAGGSYTVNEGLVDDLGELLTVRYRNVNGDDYPVDILTAEQYTRIPDKDATGTPAAVWLTGAINTRDRRLIVWPRRVGQASAQSVIGSDGLMYRCIIPHTSAALNFPITGANWRLYWERDTQVGGTWQSGVAYTHGELLRYTYRRPLLSFGGGTNDPDLPPEWTRYLMFRLAYDLSFNYTIDKETRDDLWGQAQAAYLVIFPNSTAESTDHHNKVLYF